jgi:hypothetical protein
MRPLKRKPANKYKSAKKFRNQTKRTKSANFQVMRGGIRF